MAGSAVSAIFAILHARYGHKWLSACPPGEIMAIALDEWSRGLAGYSPDEVKRGLDSWEGDWPPSLPEFKAACRPKRSASAYRQYIPLPKPTNPMSKDRRLGDYLREKRAMEVKP